MSAPNIERIRREETPLFGHPILSGALGAELAARGHARACAAFQEAARGTEFGSLNLRSLASVGRATAALVALVRDGENGRQDALRDLAVETAAEASGIPAGEAAGLLLSAELVEPDELGCVGDAMARGFAPHLTDRVRPLVRLRHTHNALIAGTALLLMTEALPLARSALQRIHPGLYRNCRMLANLSLVVQYLAPPYWTGSPRSGTSRVVWRDGEARLECRASYFFVLVMEIAQGLAELNFLDGLPRAGELTLDEQAAFSYHAEQELLESWNFQMGPALARRLQEILVGYGLIRRYMPAASFGRDLAFTRALIARIPEAQLHGLLPGLLTGLESKRAVAAARLGALLEELECRAA